MLSKIYNLSFNSASFKTPWQVIQANNKFINLMTWIQIKGNPYLRYSWCANGQQNVIIM